MIICGRSGWIAFKGFWVKDHRIKIQPELRQLGSLLVAESSLKSLRRFLIISLINFFLAELHIDLISISYEASVQNVFLTQ